MRPRWRLVAIVLFSTALVAGGLLGDRVLALTDETRGLLRDYTELVTVAHERYGAEVEYRDLVYSSIQGMVRSLDPHTSFLPPEAYASMRERQQTTFYGLGILVGMRNNLLTVITPIEGTPAARMGLRAGDVISTIEGDPTEGMNIDEAVRRLKGPKGTKVRIEIVRQGLSEPLELVITRDEIPQETVRYVFMVGPTTGYLAISDFNRGTGKEVAAAIRKLRERGMERLLIDLRNNGGGLLDQAIAVADQFLPAGTKIVETRGRVADSFQEYFATSRYPELGLPVVVLVNGGTASAAEILAGAIQDHDVGLIVGTPTWGKGLVQTVYTLSYGAGIAVTTAKYYTPSGRLIQRDYSSWFDYASFGNGGENGIEGRERDQSEIFLTDLGRAVYGGGGIAPDVEIEGEEIPKFVQYLLSRSAFFDFAIYWGAEHRVDSPDWQPGPEVLDEFAKWLVEQDLVTASEQKAGFEELANGALIERYLRAEVLNAAFGIEARYEALATGDFQIRKAIETFDLASELLARRRLLRQEDVASRADEPVAVDPG